MAKRVPERRHTPDNVVRGSRDEEREARVEEIVTRLQRGGASSGGKAPVTKSSKTARHPHSHRGK